MGVYADYRGKTVPCVRLSKRPEPVKTSRDPEYVISRSIACQGRDQALIVGHRARVNFLMGT
jgi:hypothetical protein